MERRTFAGLDVVVESPKGSARQWHDRAAGKSGETVMQHDYGYLADHMGADGDEVDVYLGPDESAPFAHVVHQLKAPEFKAFDEDKVMLGFVDEAAAKAAYLAHRDDGERAYGGMTSMPLERFKAKLSRRTGDGKIRHERGPLVAFAAGTPGAVAAGKWDRICVPTGEVDVKDGMETVFNRQTMTEMIDNFVDRGDLIPVDHNHQTNYAAQNGQAAPALAWYGVLAIVEGGKVVHAGMARDVAEGAPPPQGVDDGLWGYRTEVTPLGQDLLPNFKYLSPTFTPEGTRRDGTPCGYSLIAVAATNSPFQAGTQITFEQAKGAHLEHEKESAPMKMSPELMAKLGLAEDASAEEAYAALSKHFEESDKEKAEMAAKLAKYEEAEMAKHAAEGAEEPAMAKHEADKDEDKKDEKKDASMAVMQASLEAATKKIAALEAAEQSRVAAAKAEADRRCEALADQAIAGGYDKAQRAALVSFARSDFDAARGAVAHLLPKTGAPAHLFDRVSKQGGPVGGPTSARETQLGPEKARRVASPLGTFVEHDSTFAGEIKKLAESSDPAAKAKVDNLIPAARRGVMFERLLAAGKIVRAERPDLALAADGE